MEKPTKAPDKPLPLPREIALSLSGCGFLGTYHFGVIICFQKNAKELMSRVTRCAGASAGSLLATLIVLAPQKLEDGLKQMYELADEIHRLRLGAMTPGFRLNERLALIVDRFLPDDVQYANDRLRISVTNNKTRANRMITHYPSREYLRKCLMASCYIPMYSMGYYGVPPELDGEHYIDGGFTNNLPMFHDVHTITISPFSGSALISPNDNYMFEWKVQLGNQLIKVNMRNVQRGVEALFPPSSRVLHSYYELGFRDGMKFLIQNGYFERPEGTEV
ncbi:Patatin-like phospholipase family protein [Aphelenchoides avenae]|nr:Patatin-like phospholipase family protein [Aphelenchus avenae]